MKAQHASNERAKRKKTPANGKPKKVSAYQWVALSWWQSLCSDSWICDASLTTSNQFAEQLTDLLRRRAHNHFRGVDASFTCRVLRTDELLGMLPRGTDGEIHPFFGIFTTVGRKKDFLHLLDLMRMWLPLAQDGKADLHFLTWVEKGCPMPKKRGIAKPQEGAKK